MRVSTPTRKCSTARWRRRPSQKWGRALLELDQDVEGGRAGDADRVGEPKDALGALLAITPCGQPRRGQPASSCVGRRGCRVVVGRPPASLWPVLTSAKAARPALAPLQGRRAARSCQARPRFPSHPSQLVNISPPESGVDGLRLVARWAFSSYSLALIDRLSALKAGGGARPSSYRAGRSENARCGDCRAYPQSGAGRARGFPFSPRARLTPLLPSLPLIRSATPTRAPTGGCPRRRRNCVSKIRWVENAFRHNTQTFGRPRPAIGSKTSSRSSRIRGVAAS